MFGCDCCCLSSFIYLVGLLTIAKKVVPFVLKKIKGNKPLELQEKNFKKDVVYLYQFPGTNTASSMSPFCIKIEAFCRFHGIKIERRNTFANRGSNNLLPFIEFNGVQHSDSQLIIRRLTQIFSLKNYPDEHIAAIGHAVDRLIDNHTFNLMLLAKVPVIDKFVGAIAASNGVPSFLVPIAAILGGNYMGKKMGGRAAISVGKFKETEYKELLRNDFTQLQTILGKKKFLLGEEPTLVDCTALGQFGAANAIPSARFYVHNLIDSSEFAPLKEYIKRVESRLFGNEFCDKK